MSGTCVAGASSLVARARLHNAMGDPRRLAILDALYASDHAVGELAAHTGMPGNLLAFHLDVLERAGAVERTVSEGDGRRRYVRLTDRAAAVLTPVDPWGPVSGVVLFVCSANSARSPLAEHLWRERTGQPACSAGTAPADRVHPLAVMVAERHGLDLSEARPVHLDTDGTDASLVVSVCDRAHETIGRVGERSLHWSVPDPAAGGIEAFERAFLELASRIDRLVAAA